MALTEQKNSPLDGLTRRGFPVYTTNPSVTSSPLPFRTKSGQSHKLNNAYMISPGIGDVISAGSFAFVEEIEVDSAEFVKIYLEGIRKYGELSKAGALIFEFVYLQMSGKAAKDKDQINLSYLLAVQWKKDLTKRTFFRGMNELLSKEFLYRSLAADVYFVNVRFMFNGNRQVVAKAYYLKGSQTQQELPFRAPPALELKSE